MTPTDAQAGPDRTNRAEYAYQTLFRLIVDGTLAPGKRLRETELARKLEVSRSPVREALGRLEQEGLVRTQRGEGRREATAVAPLTTRDARELFYLVGALEGVAAGWLAELPEKERHHLCDALADANSAFIEAAGEDNPDPLRLMALDRSFHEQIVVPVAAVRLRDLWETLKPQTVRYTRAYRTYFAQHALKSGDDHEAIVDAIRRGDSEAAERAAAENYRHGARRIAAIVTVAGEKPGGGVR